MLSFVIITNILTSNCHSCIYSICSPSSFLTPLEQMVSGSGILTEEQQDGLFSLDVIKGGGKAEGGARAALARVIETAAPGEDDMAALEADSDSEVGHI